MKKKLLMLIFLLNTVIAFSKCGSGGIEFWPSKQTISENSIFIIDGYSTSQKIIVGLGKTYGIFLITNNQKIKLNVQEILVGQYGITQAILKPEINLTIGQEYELVIENLGDFEDQVFKYDYSTGENKKIKWKVTSTSDIQLPTWKEKPIFVKSIYSKPGCGPVEYANFSFIALDNSDYLIRTTVKNKSTGKETTFYLKADNNIISVGHGMCTGAFNFVGSDKFEVEFNLCDASGNLTKWIGERIEFNRPT